MPNDQPKFLYGTHYSNPGYVLFFLVRKSLSALSFRASRAALRKGRAYLMQ